MEEKGNQVQGVHKVTIANRMQGTICGVSDVLSFDVGEIVLSTDLGMLVIKGEELHVSRLTLEQGEDRQPHLFRSGKEKRKIRKLPGEAVPVI